VITAADDTAGIDDALDLIRAHKAAGQPVVPHILCWRHHHLDVPDYNQTPQQAAIDWVDDFQLLWPTKFDDCRQHVWVGVGNELDHWDRADWIGHWSTEVAIILNQQGFKVLAPGWSGGTPEYAHWLTPGWERYLRYCELRPDKAGVSLHEYSFVVDNILRDHPWLIGRYTFLQQACDELGVAVPFILIKEFGWTYVEVPPPAQAIADIQTVWDAYPDYPAATIWYLGGGFGNIHDLTQQLIAPVTDLMLAQGPPPEPEPPPPPPPPAG
jgi:hypothetical protein